MMPHYAELPGQLEGRIQCPVLILGFIFINCSILLYHHNFLYPTASGRNHGTVPQN
ncbi:hypothetical protein BT63DRAFT_11159 [Microthyrium microscopicum]|uniref:Uncharacterized protein n=1 Tax=Microthyrium microscopicum TaxID=703497 RepID=A0A6A6UU65_9PEZI|nr:hypothetical protein BT63DRAFT_11159 [Microthyrium microscopicum]